MSDFIQGVQTIEFWYMVILVWICSGIIMCISKWFTDSSSSGATVILESPPLPPKPEIVINIEGSEDGFILVNNINQRVLKCDNTKEYRHMIRTCEIKEATQYDKDIVLINMYSGNNIFAKGDVLELFGRMEV